MNTDTNKVISIFPRGSAGNLYFEFFNNKGERKQRSTGLKDSKSNRAKAWKLVPEFEKRLEEEGTRPEKEKKQRTIKYYGDKYVNSLLAANHTKYDTHKGRVKRIVSYFGAETKPREITELDIEDFFESLNVTRDTKSDWKVTLKAIFEKARKDGVVDTNIVKEYELPSTLTQDTPEEIRMPYSEEEAEKLITNADRRLKNYLGISFNLGTRPEETIALKISDISFENQTIYLKNAIAHGIEKIITSKKGGPRDIPLFDSALPYLEDQIAWAQEERSEYLFFNKDGRRLSDSKDIRGEKGKKGFYWNDYLEKLNIIPIRRMMNTRHTFAVHCIRNMDKLNLSLNDIASIMGHSTLRMLLQHYAKYLGDKNNHISRSISIF